MTDLTDLTIVAVAGVVCSALAIGAWKAHVLDRWGALTAFMIGFATFVFPDNGWKWFLVLFVFLSVSSCMTHYKYQIKRKRGLAQEKGGARGWPNVAANGIVAGLLAVLTPCLPQQIVLAAFLGAVATANADTLATEIGLLNRTDPRLITDPRKVVPAGTSGGISILGELAALLGALATAITAAGVQVTGNPGWSLKILVGTTLIAGLAGCTLDSFVGATVQGIYRCRICNKVTENRRHCNVTSLSLRGIRWIDNNIVNLIATLFGAGVAVLMLLFS